MPLSRILRISLACCLGLLLRAGETDLERASRLMKARNYPEAQAVLDRAVQANPASAEALGLTSQLHLALRDSGKALEFADRAIRLEPARARWHLLRGNALGMKAQQVNMLRALTLAGDVRSAFEKAVQLDPKDKDCRSSLFSFYLMAPGIAGGGRGKARAFALQTIPLDPGLGHTMLGRLLQLEKNPGEAQAEYRLALASDPRNVPVINLLGYVELEMKQVDAALAHFQRAAELEPGNANSWDSLADGWMAKGRLDEVILNYRKALALDPLFISSLRGLGKALEQAGRREEAIQHYRRCCQLGAEKGIPQMVKEAKARLKDLGVKD